MEPRIPEAQRRLTEDFEWEQSIKTFTASSDRVRYIMFVVVIGFFIAMIGWDNARQNSWMYERAENARVALENNLSNGGDCSTIKDKDRNKECQKAFQWLQVRVLGRERSRLSPEDKKALSNYLPSLKYRAEKYRELDFQHYFLVHVPFVDLTFDVNDLGLVTGLSFAFIMLVLFLSMIREHENLYLCLWRVMAKFHEDRELANDERSRANLFYHSLAMAQVFANPPTLGGWNRRLRGSIPSVIFFLPLLPQGLILLSDTHTLQKAFTLNPEATLISYVGQVLCLLFVLAMSIGCWLYGRSCEIKWLRCFETINPGYSKLPRGSWARWLELPFHLRVDKKGSDGWLQPVGGSACVRLSSQLGEQWTALLFDCETLPNWQASDLDQRLRDYPGAKRITITSNLNRLEAGREPAFRGVEPLLKRWHARELAIAVVDRSCVIKHLGWRTEVVASEVVRRRQETSPDALG